MGEIFLRMVKDRMLTVIIYCLAAIGFMWMYIGMFPSMQEQSQQFEEVMKNYPQEIMKAMNIEELSFDEIEKFLAMEDFSMLWPLMAIFFMCSLAGGAIAGEIEKGTAEILLSKSISRTKIFFGKYLAGIFLLAVFTSVSVYFVAPLCTLHNVDYDMIRFVKMSVIAFLFGATVFSICYMFSAIFSDRGKPYMCTGGLLLLMYVFNIIANLKESFKNLKYMSFFHYYNQNEALIHNNINEQTLIVFVSVSVVCTVIGLIYFNKRDIAV